MWLARARDPGEERWPARFLPLRLVVVQHTAGSECYRFADCAEIMRNLQNYYFDDYRYDLPYNFLIGNDGRVYEGRGWNYVGAHTLGYNRCALGLGFMGDYRRSVEGARASPQQLNSTAALLAGGVRAGVLHARFRVLAASDVQRTVSPGDDLYAALAASPHFAHDAAIRYGNRSCDEIYGEPLD